MARGEQNEIDRSRGGQSAAVNGEQVGNPKHQRTDGQHRQYPVKPAVAPNIVQRQIGDRKGEDDRQAEDKAGRQQESALETLETGAEPMLFQQHALVAAGHFRESVGHCLDQPPHEFAQRT